MSEVYKSIVRLHDEGITLEFMGPNPRTVSAQGARMVTLLRRYGYELGRQ